MSAMDPALETALKGPNPTIFGAIEIALPNHTIRILTGSGIIVVDGNVYTGQDATYGVLYSIEDLTDGIGTQAPALTITLIPASTAAAVDLASAADQGASVTIRLGAVEPSNGLVIGEPMVIFLGELDVPILKTAANSYLLELQITSAFEAFFLADSGVVLSDTFHKYLWPGELGCSHIDGILHHGYWGSVPPSGVSK